MYQSQENFFAQAYRTGTDQWTNIPFARRAHELGLYLPHGSLVLDLGAGRGRLLYELAEMGFRGVGLENNPELVIRGNNEILEKGLEKELRFVDGSVLDIPLEDQSFDAVVDIGLLHHLLPADFTKYVLETACVLKQEGFFFLVVLSKNTKNYFSWHPNEVDSGEYERDGVYYHFFSDKELQSLFEKDFEIRHIDHDTPFGPDSTDFAVVLLKKK